MRNAAVLVIAIGLLWLPAGAGKQKPGPLDFWPQWRGPSASGVAPHGNPPLAWSEESNVRWKIEIPGKGHSSPIVWGDRVLLTTAVPYGEVEPRRDDHAHGAHDNMAPLKRMRFVVLAVNRQDGRVLWQRTVRDARPHEGTHVTGSWASSSAVTDGKRVYASFGSQGLYALDMKGELLWQADLGDMQSRHGHGEGSSPALYGDTLVVNWDHQGESFVTALDTRTGKSLWKVDRDEITSWSTPLIVAHAGKPQVVIAATGRVRAYDLASGVVVWECAGLSRNVVASPVAADGFVYVGNSYDAQKMMAIRLSAAQGDITGSEAVVWTLERHTPYVPSPLLYGDMLFFLKHNQGFLTNLNARTGKPFFGPRRLEGIGNVFASPVGAADRVYVVDRSGNAIVVRRGAEFEVLARNRLEESFSASPAIAGNELYLRGERFLYCIADDSSK